jgi:hypothetical protein
MLTYARLIDVRIRRQSNSLPLLPRSHRCTSTCVRILLILCVHTLLLPHVSACYCYICVLTLLCMLTGVTQAQVNAAPKFLTYVSAYYCYIRVLTCVLTLLHMLPGITQAQVDAAPEFPEAVRMLTEWLAAQGFPSVSSPETSDETRVSAQDKSRVSVYADVC